MRKITPEGNGTRESGRIGWCLRKFLPRTRGTGPLPREGRPERLLEGRTLLERLQERCGTRGAGAELCGRTATTIFASAGRKARLYDSLAGRGPDDRCLRSEPGPIDEPAGPRSPATSRPRTARMPMVSSRAAVGRESMQGFVWCFSAFRFSEQRCHEREGKHGPARSSCGCRGAVPSGRASRDTSSCRRRARAPRRRPPAPAPAAAGGQPVRQGMVVVQGQAELGEPGPPRKSPRQTCASSCARTARRSARIPFAPVARQEQERPPPADRRRRRQLGRLSNLDLPRCRTTQRAGSRSLRSRSRSTIGRLRARNRWMAKIPRPSRARPRHKAGEERHREPFRPAPVRPLGSGRGRAELANKLANEAR